MSELPLRAQLASVLGKSAATLSRATGRGDGSVIGGRVALKVEPGLLAKLARGRQLTLVSATNGKTTTTRLIVSALRELGEIATNDQGANMPTGHITALGNSPNARYGVLEVDEKYLPQILRTITPAVVVLMNLSRDQMDRASEINLMAKKWRDALGKSEAHVVANADDPLVAWAGLGARHTTWSPPGSAGRRTPGAAPSAAATSNASPTRTGSAPSAACAARTRPGRWTTRTTSSSRPTGSACRCS